MPVETISTVTLAVAVAGVALAVAIIVRLARLSPSSQLLGLEAVIAGVERLAPVSNIAILNRLFGA